jgi:hypothetical protein
MSMQEAFTAIWRGDAWIASGGGASNSVSTKFFDIPAVILLRR